MNENIPFVWRKNYHKEGDWQKPRGDRMNDVMSAIGTKQTCASALRMSAFGGKAASPICQLSGFCPSCESFFAQSMLVISVSSSFAVTSTRSLPNR
jgi:hypothetical protein